MQNEKATTKKAMPQVPPRPTYWPAMLAMALLFTGWGLITTWVLSAAGAVAFFIALAGWIKELVYEHRSETGK